MNLISNKSAETHRCCNKSCNVWGGLTANLSSERTESMDMARGLSPQASTVAAPAWEHPTPAVVWAGNGGEHDDALVAAMIEAVAPLEAVIRPDAEVVLHDLRGFPNSIVAIAGSVTGRSIGGSATEGHRSEPSTTSLLQQLIEGTGGNLVSYEMMTDDGRRLQSRTTIIRGGDGKPLIALCLNTAIPERPGETPAVDSPEPATVDALARRFLAEAISAEEVPIDEMKKRHKVRVVRRLLERGVFELRDAIDLVASALDVSRFTIYNYLNELDRGRNAG